MTCVFSYGSRAPHLPEKIPETTLPITPFPEVYMQSSPTNPSPTPVAQAERRPFLVSFDSGREFSLDHWMEVSWLVERQQDELEGYIFEDCLLTR